MRYVMEYCELSREFDEEELRRLLWEWGVTWPDDVVKKINRGIPYYAGIATIRLRKEEAA